MARSVTTLALALALAVVPGCFFGKSYGTCTSPEHIVSNLDHPWHAIPAQIVALPVMAVGGVCVLPLTPLEYAITGKNPVSRSQPGFLLSGIGYIAIGAGAIVGLPFYLAGLPFGAERREETAKKPAVDPAPAATPADDDRPIPTTSAPAPRSPRRSSPR
jgi:hypothetical protein